MLGIYSNRDNAFCEAESTIAAERFYADALAAPLTLAGYLIDRRSNSSPYAIFVDLCDRLVKAGVCG